MVNRNAGTAGESAVPEKIGLGAAFFNETTDLLVDLPGTYPG